MNELINSLILTEVRFVFSPKWFYGIDIVLETLSMVILFLISYSAYKWFKLSRFRNYRLFSYSFFILGLSYLFKILTNVTIYYPIIQNRKLGLMNISFKTIGYSEILSSFGFFMFHAMTLIGLYLLYKVIDKQKFNHDFIFIMFFILVTTLFSHYAFYMFHIAALMFLFVITLIYIKNYQKQKKKNTMLLAVAFAILALSHLIFSFLELGAILYVIAEAIQIISYAILLYVFIITLKYGKKKRPA